MRRWWPVVLGIAAYDLALIGTGQPSLSAEFAQACRHPVHRWWVVVGWSYLTVHLIDVLPDRWDPLGQLLGGDRGAAS